MFQFRLCSFLGDLMEEEREKYVQRYFLACSRTGRNIIPHMKKKHVTY
jgi:hypothetical protein